jgi:hypothetical protein
VFTVYGPSYAHDRLNAATHTALCEMFGRIRVTALAQMVRIIRKGRVVDSAGRDTYVTSDNAKNLRLPVMFVAGARNQIFYPETSELTLEWLRGANPESAPLYTRHVFQDYAHMDLFIGKDAARDIFPFLVETLKSQKG